MKDPNKRGDSLRNPNQAPKKQKKDKEIDIKQDGLMEREEVKVLTKDGRQLL
jgi:hypothetical protein